RADHCYVRQLRRIFRPCFRAASLFLRLVALDYLLPYNAEPDKHILSQARQLKHGTGPFFPAYGAYPHLLAWLLSLLPGAEVAPGRASLEDHLRAASSEVLAARRLLSLLSVISLPLLYSVCRFVCSRGVSLLAAFLYAFSLLQFGYSQQARPHAAAVTFLLLGLLSCLHLQRDRTWKGYAAAGLSVGLALSALQTNVVLLLTGLVAHSLASRGRSWREHLKLGLPVALIALLGYAFYPFLFAFRLPPEATTNIGTTAWPHRFELGWLSGGGAAKAWHYLWTHDPLLLLLSLGGAALLLLRLRPEPGVLPRTGPSDREARRKAATVIASHGLGLLILLVVYERTYARLFLPLMPHLALLAALFLSTLWSAAKRESGGVLAPGVRCVLILVVLAQTVPCLRFFQLKLRTDTMTLATGWLQRYDASAEPTRENLFAVTPWLTFPASFPVREAEGQDLQGSEMKVPWFKYLARLEEEDVASEALHIVPLAPGGCLPASSQDMFNAVGHYPEILEQLNPDYCVLQPLG
ncbi:MAG: glycosyltransferase family 39 protein, partial [Planctomycetota bacterium]